AEGAFANLITSAGERFLRCHFAIPHLGDDHVVEIGGAVVRSRSLTLPELRSMPRLVETVVTECAGNGRAMLDPPVSGEQWAHRGVSAAQWTGIPLRSVLELAESAVEVVFTGADGGGGYQRSLPREVALDEGTLLAYEMNGEPIPTRFGGPVRLVVPGWYGMASVKWLARIEAVERPFHGAFLAALRADLDPSGAWPSCGCLPRDGPLGKLAAGRARMEPARIRDERRPAGGDRRNLDSRRLRRVLDQRATRNPRFENRASGGQ